jgi:hypothetical protein
MTRGERRIVTHMLEVSTLECRTPIAVFIGSEAYDATLHRICNEF